MQTGAHVVAYHDVKPGVHLFWLSRGFGPTEVR